MAQYLLINKNQIMSIKVSDLLNNTVLLYGCRHISMNVPWVLLPSDKISSYMVSHNMIDMIVVLNLIMIYVGTLPA